MIVSIFLIILGFVLLIKGADYLVDGAVGIAKKFNIPEIVIGLTIVSIGTSLPEFVTSVVAAKKGESDIAIGNVIGSNIFNILFVLGLSSVITPIVISASDVINSMYDVIIVALVTLLMFIPIVRKQKISRLMGSIMVIGYIAYMVYIIMR